MSAEHRNKSELVDVVMFAKAPIPGKVKTRLAQTIGFELAAEYHAAFLLDLSCTLAKLRQHDASVQTFLSHAGGDDNVTLSRVIESGLASEAQSGGDLGERLDACARAHLLDDTGECSKLIIIGSDSPTLSVEHFRDAIDALDRADVVFGPSFDGGYYLVGMRSYTPIIFDDVEWSTPLVLAQSLQRCRQGGLSYELLEFYYDVDTIDDLRTLTTHVRYHLAHTRPSDYSETKQLLEALDPKWLGVI